METKQALSAFAALSQPTRLRVFRLLIAAGWEGMAAGEIATALDVRQNTLSANLSVLLNAGLVGNQRRGRSIRYFAEIGTVQELMGFLLHDCCGGRPDLCQPLIDEIAFASAGSGAGKGAIRKDGVRKDGVGDSNSRDPDRPPQ